MEKPHGYMIQGKENKVYHLKKELYGIKQASHTWNSKIDKYLLEHVFSRSPSEPYLYVKANVDHFLILCMCMDNLIYNSIDARMIEDFKKTMMQEYEITSLGHMKYFLGMQVKQRLGQIFIS